jgi:hypothetical protein
MSSQNAPEMRRLALEADIADRVREGFQVESKTETQAILVRRSLVERVSRRPGTRLVVWVDEHGVIDSRKIEARRW